MYRLTMRYRTAWLAVVVTAVVGLVALAPHLGFTSAAPAPIWSEKPVSMSAAATVPAAELGRAHAGPQAGGGQHQHQAGPGRHVDAGPVR